MLPLLTLIALTRQDPLEQPLVFNQPTGVLRKVVAQLSAQTHVPMRVSEAVWDVGVYVESKNWTLKQVMDGLADVSFGIWEKQPDSSWLLRKSSNAETVARAAEVKRLTPIIQQWKEQQRSEAAKPVATMADWTNLARAQKGEESASYPDVLWPAERLLARLEGLFPASELARLPIGRRVVYSTNPTAAQRPLNAQLLEPLLRDCVRESKLWQQAGMQGNEGARLGSFMPDRLQVAFTKQPMGGNIGMEATAYDASGAEPAVSSASISLTPIDEDEDLDTPNDEWQVRLSKETQEWITQLSALEANAPTKEALAKLLDFEAHDPLRYVPTDVGRMLAKKEGGNLVAAAPDALTALAMMVREGDTERLDLDRMLDAVEVGKLRAGVFRARLPELMPMFTHSRAEWIRLRDLKMQRPLEAVDYQEYMARVHPGYFADGFFGIDITDVGYLLVALVNAGPGENPLYADTRALWWGGLTAAQRSEVLTGRSVSLTQLNSRQRSLIASCLYDGSCLRLDGLETARKPAPLEPTISFPTFPTRGEIHAVSEQRATYLLLTQDGKAPLHGRVPEQVDGLADSIRQAQADRARFLIQPYRSTIFSVRFDFGRGLHMLLANGRSEHKPVGKPVSLSALPASLQKEIADLIKQYEESPDLPIPDIEGPGEIKPPQR